MVFDTPLTSTRARLTSARLAATLVLAGFLTMPAAAQPSAPPGKPGQARAGAARPGPAPIICTKLGCKPLPRGCHAETEFTWDGDPTSYQFIVCP